MRENTPTQLPGGARLELTIKTGPVAAAVQLLLAVRASVTGGAAAGVSPSRRFHTGASVEAGPIGAGHGDDLAVLAIKALRAGARVVVLQVLWTNRENVAYSQFG